MALGAARGTRWLEAAALSLLSISRAARRSQPLHLAWVAGVSATAGKRDRGQRGRLQLEEPPQQVLLLLRQSRRSRRRVAQLSLQLLQEQ